jgi:two-component system, OmpR family, sensor kinase
MKIFKSIKWRLQIWYGLILVAVLAGFGFMSYQLDFTRQSIRIQNELRQRIDVLANALHRPPPFGPNAAAQRFDPPPPDQFPNDGPPGQNVRPLFEFHLPPEDAHFFDASEPHSFYFIIRSRDRKEIARSNNAPNRPEGSPDTRAYGHMLQSGEIIWVGCSFTPELKELRQTALKLAGFGVIILLFGIAGGWWFVSRALRPVENISAAAVKISAGDLSQRINVAEAESELGKLAAVLNSTFARLDAAFAQQKQFASDAAHELRTPVSVILTQTQTSLNRERPAAEYRDTLEACQRAAQRMRKLIGALLELARLDAGQEQMKRLRFDFSRTVADGVELVKPLAEESGITIFTELAPLEINGDPERLAQVTTNLLTNAIQYNQPGGEVRVKLDLNGGLAVLTVSDTGDGISREDLPHVFERFYRGDKSRTGGPPSLRFGAAGNAGLGLAISKAIVEAHGGVIEVAGKTGGGTTFTVRLPAGQAGPD